MFSGNASLQAVCNTFFTIVLIILGILVVVCLIRAILGPRTADRIIASNMMGTLVMTMIAILTLMMGEGFLADIALIYALISFLAVVVLTKVYTGVYLEKKMKEKEKQQDGNV